MANADIAINALQKPTKGSWTRERRERTLAEESGHSVLSLKKPRPRVLDKRQAALDKEANWREVSKLVKARDLVCRVCKGHGDHIHHIVYRSHGGKDVASNLILTCAGCHADIHAKVVLVTFKAINPALTIRFERNAQWDGAL